MRLKEIVSYSLDHGVVIDAFAEISLDGIDSSHRVAVSDSGPAS